jgi:hypothetical protein
MFELKGFEAHPFTLPQVFNILLLNVSDPWEERGGSGIGHVDWPDNLITFEEVYRFRAEGVTSKPVKEKDSDKAKANKEKRRKRQFGEEQDEEDEEWSGNEERATKKKKGNKKAKSNERKGKKKVAKTNVGAEDVVQQEEAEGGEEGSNDDMMDGAASGGKEEGSEKVGDDEVGGENISDQDSESEGEDSDQDKGVNAARKKVIGRLLKKLTEKEQRITTLEEDKDVLACSVNDLEGELKSTKEKLQQMMNQMASETNPAAVAAATSDTSPAAVADATSDTSPAAVAAADGSQNATHPDIREVHDNFLEACTLMLDQLSLNEEGQVRTTDPAAWESVANLSCTMATLSKVYLHNIADKHALTISIDQTMTSMEKMTTIMLNLQRLMYTLATPKKKE